MCGDILCALLQKYHYSSNACASSAAQCMHVPPVQHNACMCSASSAAQCMHVQCLQCSTMHACAVPPVQHNACMCSASSAAQCMHVQCLQCSTMHACAVPPWPVQHNIVLNYYICMHVQVGAFSLGCLFKALNELVSFS